MPKGVSINQQCGKLEPLLFESHGVAETNFFPNCDSQLDFSDTLKYTVMLSSLVEK